MSSQAISPSASETPTELAEPRFLIARLSVLIFLAFAIMGAWVPVFSLHLKNLNFSATATAWASAANAIGALLAPVVWGQVADRWMPMQRCISLCALATAGGLWLMAEVHTAWIMMAACIAMWFFLIPAIGLTTSLTFRQLTDREHEYGKIRMWGTVGWMAASWSLTGWLWIERWGGEPESAADFADSLRLGALAALALAVYAWTLPHTPPMSAAAAPRAWYARLIDAPLSTLHLFEDRSFVVYCVCMFGFNVTLPFTIQLNPLLLSKLEIDARMSSMCLSIAQSTEVLFLFLLPMLLMRFGSKAVMIVGGMSWTLGLGLLSVGSPVGLVLASLLTHGVFICCFFIAGQVFVNRLATHDIRASAQGVLLLISGSGLLLGHLLVGWLRDATAENYEAAYGIAAVTAGILTVIFLIGFSPSPTILESDQETLVPDSEIP